jgi:hypothetical protein
MFCSRALKRNSRYEVWQLSETLSLQRLDSLLSMEAGAVGLSKDVGWVDLLS